MKSCIARTCMVSLKTQRAGGETPGGETGEFYAMSLLSVNLK